VAAVPDREVLTVASAETMKPGTMSLGRLGGVYALLHGGHVIADHWIQRGGDAQAKAGDGWPARVACARHVAQITATQAVFLAVGCAATVERLSVRRVAVGLAVNAVTHYALDRRPFARKLAYACGKADFYDGFSVQREGWLDPHGPGSGPYALDQAAHVGILSLVAAIIAGGRP
jgi:hypothetical protein